MFSIIYSFWFFFNKQHNMSVYHIMKCDCQRDCCFGGLVDLVDTFQAISGCEISLYLDISGSNSAVIIQCVSEVNTQAFWITTSCVQTPPFMHFLSLSVSQVEADGDEEVLSCVGGRSFRSVRERWWYIALSKCGVSIDLRPDSSGSSSLYGQVYNQAVAMVTDYLHRTNAHMRQ